MNEKKTQIKILIIGIFLYYILKLLKNDIKNYDDFILLIIISCVLYYYYNEIIKNYNEKKIFLNQFIKTENYILDNEKFLEFIYNMKKYSTNNSYKELIIFINNFLKIERNIYTYKNYENINSLEDIYKKSMNLLHSFIYKTSYNLNTNYNSFKLDNEFDLHNKSNELRNMFLTHIDTLKKDSNKNRITHRSKLFDLSDIESFDKFKNINSLY